MSSYFKIAPGTVYVMSECNGDRSLELFLWGGGLSRVGRVVNITVPNTPNMFLSAKFQNFLFDALVPQIKSIVTIGTKLSPIFALHLQVLYIQRNISIWF